MTYVQDSRRLLINLCKSNQAENLDLNQIAASIPGFSGADLANLVNEATLVATLGKGKWKQR